MVLGANPTIACSLVLFGNKIFTSTLKKTALFYCNAVVVNSEYVGLGPGSQFATILNLTSCPNLLNFLAILS
jgi:hypothetical protein